MRSWRGTGTAYDTTHQRARRGPALMLAGWAAALLCFMLAGAALAYAPDQADAGAKVYTGHCSTCHGDVGQGLTDEFRMTWAEGDRNCWIPACHGGNPPKPGGFTIPRFVPAVAGPGTLAKFSTALQLHEYIKAVMPFQDPHSLSEDEYWQLTAYLLRANGVPPDDKALDAGSAGQIAVPRAGQPVPVPIRTPGPAPATGTSMRARAQVAPPPTAPLTVAAAQLSTTVPTASPAPTPKPTAAEQRQAVAQVAAPKQNPAQPAPAPASSPGRPTTSVWIAVIVLVAGGAAAALVWRRQRNG